MLARITYIIFATFCFISLSQAQPFIRQRTPFSENFSTQFSAWILDSSKDSVTVAFTYRIPYSRIIFIKSQETQTAQLSESETSSYEKDRFDAVLTFSVDATDSSNGINHHGFHVSKIATHNFGDTQSSKIFAEDIVILTLPKSTFRVNAELRDDGQQITYFNERRDVNYTNEKLSGILSTFFLDSLSHHDIYPELQNNVAPFPHTVTVAVLMEDTTSRPLTFTLESGPMEEVGKPERRELEICKLDSIMPLKDVLSPGKYAITNGTSDTNKLLLFTFAPSATHSLYIAHFKVDTLQEGRYTIRITSTSKAQQHILPNVIHFSYVWLDKPFTLRNFHLALSLLKYIVNDSVFSYISSGNEKEQKEKFDHYWKLRNPNTKSAFNPLEAEFYQRADYAYEHFKTISENNGAATDRGKSYILFGKPAEIKREFRSDGTYEIWYYPNLKKSIVFKEEGYGGNFKLYQTKDL
jgi:GWxTD domain-containing protein